MPLTIGQVAKAAEVNIETIWYYERRGLFTNPYLTLAEGIRLAAQTFDKDVAKLSCCAA